MVPGFWRVYASESRTQGSCAVQGLGWAGSFSMGGAFGGCNVQKLGEIFPKSLKR